MVYSCYLYINGRFIISVLSYLLMDILKYYLYYPISCNVVIILYWLCVVILVMTSFNFNNYCLSFDDNLYFSTTYNETERTHSPLKTSANFVSFLSNSLLSSCESNFGILVPSPQITFECRFEYDELLLRIVLLHNAQLSLSRLQNY